MKPLSPRRFPQEMPPVDDPLRTRYATLIGREAEAGMNIYHVCLSDRPLRSAELVSVRAAPMRGVDIVSYFGERVPGAAGAITYDPVARSYGVERLQNTPVQVLAQDPSSVLPSWRRNAA